MIRGILPTLLPYLACGWSLVCFGGLGMRALAQTPAPDLDPPPLRMNQVATEERIRLALTLDQLRTLVENTETQLRAAQTDADRGSIEAEFEQQETAILIANGFSRDRYQVLLALFLGDPDFQTIINRLVSESRRP